MITCLITAAYAVTQAFELMPRIAEEINSATYSDAIIQVGILDSKSNVQQNYTSYGSWVALQVSWNGTNYTIN